MIDRLHIIAVKGIKEVSEDNLFHGALYGIETLGSGSERVRLLKSDPLGKRSMREAVKRIASIYPEADCSILKNTTQEKEAS